MILRIKLLLVILVGYLIVGTIDYNTAKDEAAERRAAECPRFKNGYVLDHSLWNESDKAAHAVMACSYRKAKVARS